VQARERDVGCAGAQCGQRALHRGVAKDGL
jgi:hypothetical protein